MSPIENRSLHALRLLALFPVLLSSLLLPIELMARKGGNLSVEELPHLSVVGNSLLHRPADQVLITLGVISEAPTAAEALKENNEKMRAVIDALSEVRLAKGEYESDQFVIRPLYTEQPKHSDPDWQPTIRGYQVSNRLLIKTSQIDQVGVWLDVAVKRGINNIDDLSFTIQEPRVYRKEALQMAASYAKADAEQLAAAMGVKLKKVLTLSLDDQRPIRYQRNFAMMSSPGDTTPIVAGMAEVGASVSVTYEIEE